MYSASLFCVFLIGVISVGMESENPIMAMMSEKNAIEQEDSSADSEARNSNAEQEEIVQDNALINDVRDGNGGANETQKVAAKLSKASRGFNDAMFSVVSEELGSADLPVLHNMLSDDQFMDNR